MSKKRKMENLVERFPNGASVKVNCSPEGRVRLAVIDGIYENADGSFYYNVEFKDDRKKGYAEPTCVAKDTGSNALPRLLAEAHDKLLSPKRRCARNTNSMTGDPIHIDSEESPNDSDSFACKDFTTSLSPGFKIGSASKLSLKRSRRKPGNTFLLQGIGPSGHTFLQNPSSPSRPNRFLDLGKHAVKQTKDFFFGNKAKKPCTTGTTEYSGRISELEVEEVSSSDENSWVAKSRAKIKAQSTFRLDNHAEEKDDCKNSSSSDTEEQNGLQRESMKMSQPSVFSQKPISSKGSDNPSAGLRSKGWLEDGWADPEAHIRWDLQLMGTKASKHAVHNYLVRLDETVVFWALSEEQQCPVIKDGHTVHVILRCSEPKRFEDINALLAPLLQEEDLIIKHFDVRKELRTIPEIRLLDFENRCIEFERRSALIPADVSSTSSILVEDIVAVVPEKDSTKEDVVRLKNKTSYLEKQLDDVLEQLASETRNRKLAEEKNTSLHEQLKTVLQDSESKYSALFDQFCKESAAKVRAEKVNGDLAKRLAQANAETEKSTTDFYNQLEMEVASKLEAEKALRDMAFKWNKAREELEQHAACGQLAELLDIERAKQKAAEATILRRAESIRDLQQANAELLEQVTLYKKGVAQVTEMLNRDKDESDVLGLIQMFNNPKDHND